MKTINSIILAAAAMVFAVACNKELPADAPEAAVETVVFTATMDGADSKATLNETTKLTEWKKGDQVTIHNGTKGYSFTASSAGASTDLIYTGNDFSANKVMAVYPAGTYTADLEAKTVKSHIPISQVGVKNTFNESAALAVAYSETNALSFKHAVSLLKFKVKGSNVKEVVFYVNDGRGVSGDVVVSLNEDNSIKSVVPQKTNFDDKLQNITWVKLYSETNNWCFEDGATYYLAVAPQEYPDGFTIELNVDGVGTVDVKKRVASITLEPGQIYNLGELSTSSDWFVAGTFNEWSTSKSPMYLDNGWYVIKGVTGLNHTDDDGNGESDTGFKFVHKGTWKGSGDGKIKAGDWCYVWGDNGKNIYVEGASAEDKYDIYLNPNEGDHGRFKIVRTGTEVAR